MGGVVEPNEVVELVELVKLFAVVGLVELVELFAVVGPGKIGCAPWRITTVGPPIPGGVTVVEAGCAELGGGLELAVLIAITVSPSRIKRRRTVRPVRSIKPPPVWRVSEGGSMRRAISVGACATLLPVVQHRQQAIGVLCNYGVLVLLFAASCSR